MIGLKDKWLPKDYHLYLFRKMQKQFSVKEYTEEFYKFNIRAGSIEDNPKRVARYINGLLFEIQDEINLLSLSSVKGFYVYTHLCFYAIAPCL